MSYVKEVINQQAFFDGQSFDRKIGSKSSFAYSRGFDWRKNPSELVQAMQARQASGVNISELIVNIEQTITGERFAIGENGTLYSIDTNNAVSVVGSIGEPAGHGLKYRQDTDMLYITGATAVHTYGQIQESDRQMRRNVAGETVSANTSTTASFPSVRTGGYLDYQVQNALQENYKLQFTSDIEPLRAIRLQIKDIGTGDWTVKIHDPLNRELASKTITAAEMAAMGAGKREFRFSTPVEMLVKPNARIYHAHVYTSTGDGKLATASLGVLDQADFELVADRLVSSGDALHPMDHFLQYLAIANGRYLSLWEPISQENPDNEEFEKHKLVYPDGYDACGQAVTDEFIITAFKRTSTDASRDFQDGLLGFYDGLSGTYNFYIRLTEGAPTALYTKDNIPHIIVGGTLYVWLGGKTLTRVRDLPQIDNDFTGVKDDTKVNPYMMTSFKKLLHLGHPTSSSNENLEFGVYNYGTVAPEYDPSFGFQYALSHGQLNTDDSEPLEIGCVRAFGDEMYISWRKGSNYGLDIVDSNCKPASSFKATMREFDAMNTHKPKGGHRVIVSTRSVPTGTQYRPYAILDDDSVQYGEYAVAGSNQAVLNVEGNAFRVVEYGLEGESDSTATQPLRVTGIAFEWDAKNAEDITDER